jgi:magnesium-transporting ATPase (P-type)
LIRYGPNSLRTHRVLALLATTAVVSFFLGDRTLAIIIGVILVASIGLGFVNEYRAERASAVDKSRQEHPPPGSVEPLHLSAAAAAQAISPSISQGADVADEGRPQQAG